MDCALLFLTNRSGATGVHDQDFECLFTGCTDPAYDECRLRLAIL